MDIVLIQNEPTKPHEYDVVEYIYNLQQQRERERESERKKKHSVFSITMQ